MVLNRRLDDFGGKLDFDQLPAVNGRCGGSGSYRRSSSSSGSGSCSGNNTLLNSIEKESGVAYNNNCDDWAISVLNDADITIGTTALKGDKTCQIRQEELIAQCNNELTSYTQMQTAKPMKQVMLFMFHFRNNQKREE
jgi:hypothetical protein